MHILIIPGMGPRIQLLPDRYSPLLLELRFAQLKPIMLPQYGVIFDGSRFWIVHRQAMHGPFDYQWSFDLDGIEMLYQGQKFGECCSDEELFADLKSFRLPLKVSKVATIVIGSVILGIFEGMSDAEKTKRIFLELNRAGFTEYASGLKAA